MILSAAIESFDEIVEFQLDCAPDLVRACIVPRGIPLASLSERVGQQLAERLRVVGAIPPRIEVELKLLQTPPLRGHKDWTYCAQMREAASRGSISQ